jgi:hypothetical protein
MEAAHFRSFYHFEPDIRSDPHSKPELQFVFDIQSGVITHDDKPDFRVQVGAKTIGIEVTRLFTSLGAPALESTQESIFDQACRQAERLNLPPVDVILFFNVCKSLRRADCCRIADAIVRLIAANIPSGGNRIDLEHRPGQPPEVDLIQINPRIALNWAVGAPTLHSARSSEIHLPLCKRRLGKRLACCAHI